MIQLNSLQECPRISERIYAGSFKDSKNADDFQSDLVLKE